jgi:ABC-type glycerol-3-phosphate transport system substrate-binding protein
MKLVISTTLLLLACYWSVASVAAQDASTTCPNEVKVDKPFSGVTLNILGRSFGHDYFMSKVKEWEEITGATVNVPVAAASGTELNELTEEDLSTGANYYDGYIATNQNVPTLASQIDPETKKPWIMELDALIKNSPVLDWPGINSIFREYLCLYDNHAYTLPFDGDQFLLFYRRDLQEKDGWEVPKTWDELVAVAGKYLTWTGPVQANAAEVNPIDPFLCVSRLFSLGPIIT